MLKLLFLTPSMLAETLSEIVQRNHPSHSCCAVSYSEALGTDVAIIQKEDNVEEVPISSFFHHLNYHFQICILSYDVYEVGDFGEGFAFVIE